MGPFGFTHLCLVRSNSSFPQAAVSLLGSVNESVFKMIFGYQQNSLWFDFKTSILLSSCHSYFPTHALLFHLYAIPEKWVFLWLILTPRPFPFRHTPLTPPKNTVSNALATRQCKIPSLFFSSWLGVSNHLQVFSVMSMLVLNWTAGWWESA